MATRADGRGSCSPAAGPCPFPGRVLRAVLRGAAHPGLTAVEKAARRLPCLHSWEPVAQRGWAWGTRRVPRRPGRDPGCLRSQPRLPWSPGRTSEAHVRQLFWKPGQRLWLRGSTGLSPASSCSGIWGRGWDGPAFLEMLSDQEQALDFLFPPVLLSLWKLSAPKGAVGLLLLACPLPQSVSFIGPEP